MSNKEIHLNIDDVIEHTFTQDDIKRVKKRYRKELLAAKWSDIWGSTRRILSVLWSGIKAIFTLSIIIYGMVFYGAITGQIDGKDIDNSFHIGYMLLVMSTFTMLITAGIKITFQSPKLLISNNNSHDIKLNTFLYYSLGSEFHTKVKVYVKAMMLKVETSPFREFKCFFYGNGMTLIDIKELDKECKKLSSHDFHERRKLKQKLRVVA